MQVFQINRHATKAVDDMTFDIYKGETESGGRVRMWEINYRALYD